MQEAGEPSPIKALTRERLLKAQKAGKSLEAAVVICEFWKLAVAS
jgi:hypothetical protein